MAINCGFYNLLPPHAAVIPPALRSFIAALPAAEGPQISADFVLSMCLQNPLPPQIPCPLIKPERPKKKRKAPDRDDVSAAARQPRRLDYFQFRHLMKAREAAANGNRSSSSGSASASSVSSGGRSNSSSA
ncbi:cleavage stimulation factor 77 [Striga asiatica]|uniref:Cleavage stimulation factor 77 n=1 Tax=Striga asiatica TaxID=4170 RepID=A0A5A7QD99_STRAF|nr:cleavage stimulation factor 77 [Striga asiatica]